MKRTVQCLEHCTVLCRLTTRWCVNIAVDTITHTLTGLLDFSSKCLNGLRPPQLLWEFVFSLCLFNLSIEHGLRFSCETQGWFPRKSFRAKTETNNRFALGENTLAQSISCLCVSA